MNRHNALPSRQHKCHSIESSLLELDEFVKLNNLNVNRRIKKPDPVDKVLNKVDLRILVFVETQYSRLGRSLAEFLQSAKFK